MRMRRRDPIRDRRNRNLIRGGIIPLTHRQGQGKAGALSELARNVELAVRAIQYSSTPGKNVLDLFGGSGSTLVVAEQTGRKAYLMEIDTLYCDVIVRRWEAFTGQEAKRIVAEKTKGGDQ